MPSFCGLDMLTVSKAPVRGQLSGEIELRGGHGVWKARRTSTSSVLNAHMRPLGSWGGMLY